MNKQLLCILLAVIAIWLIIDTIQKQNRKMNSLAYRLNGLQNCVAESELITEFVLEQIDDMNRKIEQAEEKISKDFICGSEPDPIAISTAD